MDKKKIGVGAGIAFLAVVLILGFLGFVPVLSDLLGANRGLNLGISYTKTDYNSAVNKLGITVTPLAQNLSPSDSIVASGSHRVDQTLTSAELTALVNTMGDTWAYFPIKNTQIRINQNGSVEVQANLIMNRFDGFATALKLSDSVKQEFSSYSNLIKTNPSFYMKYTMSITDGQTQSNINVMKLGFIDVPAPELAKIQTAFASFVQRVVERTPRVINNLTFGDGTVHIVGSTPDTISLSPP